MATSGDLWRLSATEAVDLLRRREVSPLDMVEASAGRLAETEAHLNAIPTLCIERARAHAERIMADDPETPRPRGWLGGLPIAVKDLVPVAGVRTTWGSPIYADHVPPRSDIVVETLEANGAIVIGKSNTPEFGAGANTFNEVFGKTRNPWNVEKTCGGSSGGSSTALATGQVWLATGSDLGGSLRIPASFCSVFGMRPSPGRVAHGPKRLPFEGLMVDGPMARNARDCALMLDAMAGAHPEDPLSIEAPAESFADAVASAAPPARIAWSPDLGLLPVDREVAAVCAGAVETLAGAGIEVADACPDLSRRHRRVPGAARRALRRRQGRAAGDPSRTRSSPRSSGISRRGSRSTPTRSPGRSVRAASSTSAACASSPATSCWSARA